MTDFQREHRYWAIKRKHLTPEQDEQCRQFFGRLRYEGVPELECVCVESDWPIYDMVWHLVERLATGQRLPFMTDEDPELVGAELRSRKDDLEDLQTEFDDLAANAQWMADIIKTHLAHLPEAREALDASPGTSLARRDLIKQAAVLEDVCRDRDTLSTEELRFRAEELHHQAQQKEPS